MPAYGLRSDDAGRLDYAEEPAPMPRESHAGLLDVAIRTAFVAAMTAAGAMGGWMLAGKVLLRLSLECPAVQGAAAAVGCVVMLWSGWGLEGGRR